jgi:3-phosphoshikimate 1-carboxyvinyltransferase
MTGEPMSLPEALEIVPLRRPPSASVSVPGSKSITNRALVLAALTAKGYAYALRGALRCEDTEVMIDALRSLGFRVLTDWPDALVCVGSEAEEPLVPAKQAELFVANSGTTMRFLTALVSLGHGRYRLDGSPRMRERPIEDLLYALRQLGADAVSERDNGCPPVLVRAAGLRGGRVRVRGDVSSQFLSALLMTTPFARDPVYVQLEGPLVSGPYVQMTLQMVRQFGSGSICEDFPALGAEPGADFFILGPGERPPDPDEMIAAAAFHEGFDPRKHTLLRDYFIEPDASAASYFFAAAAITGGRVTVLGLPERSLQGDVRFVEVLEEMGCRVERCSAGITVHGRTLRGIDVDMNDISDTVMTLAAVACFAEGPTTVRNVAHIRHKETDRLAALATELRRVGAGVEEFADGLTITPGPLRGAAVETYNDHRMAMSMALVGLRVPGIVITNPGCVAKTYPGFFRDLEELR